MCEVRSASGKKDGMPSEFYGYGRDIYDSWDKRARRDGV